MKLGAQNLRCLQARPKENSTEKYRGRKYVLGARSA